MKTIDVLEKILKTYYDMRVDRVKRTFNYLNKTDGFVDYDSVMEMNQHDKAFIKYANLYGRLMGSEALRDQVIDTYINVRPREMFKK